MTSAQKYNSAITIQKRTVTNTRGGQPVESWNTIGTRRAKVYQSAASDQVQNDQKVNQEEYTVEVPADRTLEAIPAKDMRLLWKLRTVITLNVLTLDLSQTGRGSEIVIKCRRDR